MTRPVYACNEGTKYYVARDGFRETLMVQIGEDADGYAIEREATDDEAHAVWADDLRASQGNLHWSSADHAVSA